MSESNSDEVEVISYSLVCEAIDQYLYSSKIPEDLKQEAQNISCVIQSVVGEEDREEIVSTLNAVSPFWKSYPRGNEGGAAERSDTQTSVSSNHSWQEA